jgi:BASS family bile acid:Na+ symporter
LNLLRNRNALMLLSIALGLGAGQLAPSLEFLVLPALGLVMTVALLGVSGEVFRSPRRMTAPVLVGLALNFVVHGGLILLLSNLFTTDEAFYTGFVLVAVVPPAVAVVPFAAVLGGDRGFALLASIGCYLAALVITPLAAVVLLGAAFVHPWKIAKILLLLIILPLVASRLILWSGMAHRLEPLKGPLTNWSFALITYVIVGLNRDLILADPRSLVVPVAVALASTFVLGALIQMTCRLFHLRRELTVSLVMLGTLKNAALAGGLALSLFGDRTALPATVCAVFLILYFVWLSFWHARS